MKMVVEGRQNDGEGLDTKAPKQVQNLVCTTVKYMHTQSLSLLTWLNKL